MGPDEEGAQARRLVAYRTRRRVRVQKDSIAGLPTLGVSVFGIFASNGASQTFAFSPMKIWGREGINCFELSHVLMRLTASAVAFSKLCGLRRLLLISASPKKVQSLPGAHPNEVLFDAAAVTMTVFSFVKSGRKTPD